MASVSPPVKVDKPSFAKIAAAGLKPSSVQQNATQSENTQKHDIALMPQDGANFVSPSNETNTSAFTPKQKKLLPFTGKDSKEAGSSGTSGPQVHVHNVDSTSPPGRAPRALDGMLTPSALDDAGTQLSSSSGSIKPPSLDGKSVASGTTFALDEKESLRPDDSASVKATEDEDAFPHGPALPDSRAGSDDGVRAFRDQLREISSMEPSREGAHAQNFGHNSNPPQGVLYIPPQGPGVGTVPGSARSPSNGNQSFDYPPDPKLLEALDSPKDRIMVLKLEQDIVDFVKDAKESSLKLPQTNAFYRMLAHKLADYYMLGHIVDESTMAVRIFKTPNCRLPPPLTGITTPSTAASTPPPSGPQMKILRRGFESTGPAIANGSNVTSKTTSENGESGNDDDRKKIPASREEREARYEAARKRIMGSAKPSESPEEPVENDVSRSSSIAGKNNSRKKQRADSDDDFEARSAYSAYYPPSYTPSGPTPNSYGFPNVADSQNGQYSRPPYVNQEPQTSYQQYGMQPSSQWNSQNYHPQDGTSPWMQNQPHQQQGYDLARDFHQSMSFQPPQTPMQNANVQQGYHSPYNQQQFGGSQPPWQQQQQNSYGQGYASNAPNHLQGYQNHPQSPHQRPPNQYQDPSQTYAFGQLPSQTFPGRPPSQLEHPLPGSYKGKHFNPQSQSFVPGQFGSPNMPPAGLPAAPQSQPNSGYGAPGPMQRTTPAPSPIASSAMTPPNGHARAPNQPLKHPLPQPVFPRQPSPNVPLPSKPDVTPPRPADKNNSGPAIVSSTASGPNTSSIAKWGAPASLPAKPPPSAEPFDPAKFAQSQRQSPSASVQGYGVVPPAAGSIGLSGQGMHSPRRM